MSNTDTTTTSDVRRLRSDASAMMSRLRTVAGRDDVTSGERLDLVWREARIRDEVQSELDGTSSLALVQRRIDEARRVLTSVEAVIR